MTLPVEEFMRRFLLHVLPHGFHRIRHYGLLANAARVDNLARARECLPTDTPPDAPDPGVVSEVSPTDETPTPLPPCPCCGGCMRIIERFDRDHAPRAPPPTGNSS